VPTEKIRVGLNFGIINLITAIIAACIFLILTQLGITSEPSEILTYEDFNRPIFLFFLVVLLVPPVEEILFRFVPIEGIKLITDSKRVLWITIILVSILFGSLHGSWHHIFIQGGSGVIFSLAFLRGGLISSVTAHALTNFIVWSLLLTK